MPREGLISGFAFRVQRRTRAARRLAGSGGNVANSSAGKPAASGDRRISVGWKAQRFRLSSPKAQEPRNVTWTSGHDRPLVFVRLVSQNQDAYWRARRSPILRCLW